MASRSLGSRLRSVLLAILLVPLAALLPAGPAGSSPRPAAPAPSEAGAEAGLLGTGVTGTGPLENFTAPGSNLIRLLAGAFDPLADPLLDPGTIAL
ncbi:MAG: hypothetical protein HY658_03610, partial [Actinobacteria bacterium]|nr:hypothetical protein [Actinomycetota bacterium]